MEKVKISALNYYYYYYYYYIIIKNVLGYIEEHFEKITDCVTGEEEIKSSKSVRKSATSYSGTLTYMKLLYKRKHMWI